MSRLTVYRVEHEWTQEGPFVGPHASRPALEAHCARQRLNRGAHRDVPGFQPGYHLCGVDSLKLLHEWFGPLRDALLAAGYVLVEYQPLRTNVRLGKRQLAFPRYEATPRQVIEWPVYETEQLLLAL